MINAHRRLLIELLAQWLNTGDDDGRIDFPVDHIGHQRIVAVKKTSYVHAWIMTGCRQRNGRTYGENLR